MKIGFLIVAITALSSLGHANFDNKAISAAMRTEFIRNAKVWAAPSWYNAQTNKFSSMFTDLTTELGQPIETLSCKFDPTTQSNGATPKFYCNDDQRSYKIKYGLDSGEVFGEVAASYLFRGLGFQTDGMRSVQQVNCSGCPQDVLSKLQESYKATGKHAAVTEDRFGKEISQFDDQGWSFGELSLLSSNSEIASAQKIHREALKLLAIWIGHGDNRPAQQKLVCANGQWNLSTGKCDGEVWLTIHDLGSTFGIGTQKLSLGLRRGIGKEGKMHLEGWTKRKIWKNSCLVNGQRQAYLGKINKGGDPALEEPMIPESAREFLANLLTAFSQGEDGQARVRNLFEVSQVALRGDKVEDWVAEFNRKVSYLQNPELEAPCSKR